jgi:hypothetical protein
MSGQRQEKSPVSTIDLTPIVQPIIAVAGMVVTGLLAVYVPMGLNAFQKRTGIILTEQQQATIKGFVQTSAGVLETKLDQGALSVAHIDVKSDAVQAEAQSIINAAPIASAGLGMTVDGVAKMIVGSVDTATRTPPPVVTLAAAP